MSNITESFEEVFDEALEFKIGDLVYIKTDPDQHRRIILGFELSINGLMYKAGIEGGFTIHYNFELQTEKVIF